MEQYNTIYVDPPWSVQGWTLSAIKRLPIGEIACRDSLLLLWPAMALLPESIELLNSWDFHYGTMLTWRKGMDERSPFHGYCDHLIVAFKGDVAWAPLLRYNLHDAVRPKGRTKPWYFRDLLESTALNAFERPLLMDIFGGMWRHLEGRYNLGNWRFLDDGVLREVVGRS